MPFFLSNFVTRVAPLVTFWRANYSLPFFRQFLHLLSETSLHSRQVVLTLPGSRRPSPSHSVLRPLQPTVSAGLEVKVALGH